MPLRTRLLAIALAALLAPACSDDEGNPFDQFSFSRPPSEDAILYFVSGSWAENPGAPRELFALTAAGEPERLTTCTQRSEPCDFEEVAASSDPDRVVAVRGAIGGDPLASALYFVDLNRSVETVIALARRVQSADWGYNDNLVVYSTGDEEDLYIVQANGNEERALTNTPGFRERYPKLSPDLQAAVYEGLSSTPGKSGLFYYIGDQEPALQITAGGPGSEVLEGTPYIVGSDSAPVFAITGQFLAFRRLTGTGNGGLGTWDILALPSSDFEGEEPFVIAGGDGVYRSPPDWGRDGRLVWVETDAEADESRIVVTGPDGSDREVLYTEAAGFRMGSPKWIR